MNASHTALIIAGFLAVGALLLLPNALLLFAALLFLGVPALIFGSLAPNIDRFDAPVRKWYVVAAFLPLWAANYTVYGLLGKIFGYEHRGVMHSIGGLTATPLLIWLMCNAVIGSTLSSLISVCVALGYMAHLLEDAFLLDTPIQWIPTRQNAEKESEPVKTEDTIS